MKYFEYLIVGSGPGGAVTAFHLVRNGKNVGILEEGLALQPNTEDAYGLTDMLTKYRNSGLTVALGSPKVSYVEGKVVGGGSEVNSGLYHRTPEEVLLKWEKEFQAVRVRESDLRPYFEDCENRLSIMLSKKPHAEASLKLKEGAERMGGKAIEVPRWIDTSGPVEMRKSMSQTYLPQALEKGAQLFTGIRVLKFWFESNRWKVLAEKEREQIEFECEHLVLSAGAIQTPALLRRSGYKKKIGDSLQLHPTLKFVARFHEEISHESAGVPVHQVKDFAPDVSFGGSISSKSFIGMGLYELGSQRSEVLKEWKQMAVYYAALKTSSVGTVRVIPGFRDPIVRYRMTDLDLKKLGDGFKKLAELLFAAGASELYPSLAGGRSVQSGAPLQFDLSSKTAQLMTIHLFSSCPMGQDLNKCPVDSFGRVRSATRLYVSDASLLPTALGVNPQGTIMALAARNVDAWLGKDG